ncbi:hypothetical protein DHD32_07395 [Arenibacter sp. TNZ]|nr:hypothetical protein [Arenibacter sp. TNZ]
MVWNEQLCTCGRPLCIQYF